MGGADAQGEPFPPKITPMFVRNLSVLVAGTNSRMYPVPKRACRSRVTLRADMGAGHKPQCIGLRGVSPRAVGGSKGMRRDRTSRCG